MRNRRKRRAPVLARGISRVALPRARLAGHPLYFKCLYSVAALVPNIGLRCPRFKPQMRHLVEKPNLAANSPTSPYHLDGHQLPNHNATPGRPIFFSAHRHTLRISRRINHAPQTVGGADIATPPASRGGAMLVTGRYVYRSRKRLPRDGGLSLVGGGGCVWAGGGPRNRAAIRSPVLRNRRQKRWGSWRSERMGSFRPLRT